MKIVHRLTCFLRYTFEKNNRSKATAVFAGVVTSFYPFHKSAR